MTDSPQAPIRVLVVDDEPLAREKIRGLAADDPELRVVGECTNGAEAIEAVQSIRPDLILLDVQMPEVGGFAVLEALKDEGLPPVIFITAYDHYAVRAFEFHALDYLLKPFDRERFRAAIDRAKRQIRRENGDGLDARILALLEQIREQPTRYSERLVVKTGGRVFFLNTDEIDWIEAEGNYVSIHTGKKAYLLRETITSLEAQLDPKDFVRIHRSAIANINRIKELQPWSHGEYHVILHDGTQLTLSRSFREKLQSALGNSL
ncbi:MAG: two-component system, LytTR family, response regulator [Acidobacteriota bacterium]|jgi:two-component system LytT family response regulator|nr:two-component system, LytTR family, response regulator [Acidobacteriota bacterium]MDT5262421.1 two-component system, LytTR family, response regulator [Acidobacteriota bacterium]MDT7781407.1 two-component system, LytTR family, response regulator [Acidobacteriota bacterium]